MNIETVIDNIYIIIGSTPSNKETYDDQIKKLKGLISSYCKSGPTGTPIEDDIVEVAEEIYKIIKPKSYVRIDEKEQYLKQIKDIKIIIKNFCYSNNSGPTGRIIGNTQVFTEPGPNGIRYSAAPASMGVGPRRDNQTFRQMPGGRSRKRKRSRRYKRRR